MSLMSDKRRTFILYASELASASATWNTARGGDALRSAFFPSGSSVKLIRRFKDVLCDIKLVAEVMNNQEGKVWVEGGSRFVLRWRKQRGASSGAF
jgi:hypothetical protein